MGNVLAFVAIPWFVLQTTGSAAKTGLTGGAFLLAAVVAGVVGGPVVDRLSFKRASIVADLAGAVTVALIPLLYHTIGLAFWQLLMLVFLGGFLDAPGHTARQSLVPELAGKAKMRIERANAAFQGIQHASFLLGPPLAGVLIAVFTPSNVLWIDAATFVISAALVSALIPSVVPRVGTAAAESRRAGRYLAELAEGITFIRRDRLVFWMFGIGIVANFLILPLFAVVLSVYAKQTYGSAVNLGLMLGASVAARWGHRLLRDHRPPPASPSDARVGYSGYGSTVLDPGRNALAGGHHGGSLRYGFCAGSAQPADV